MKVLVVACMGAMLCSVGAASAETLDETAIRQDIVGRTIFLAAPMGGEFPLNYRASGQVDGNGKALGLGKFIKPNDTGRWWIQSDRLCQQFKVWYDGSPMCFELSKVGADKVKWVRDNGETGVARIGN